MNESTFLIFFVYLLPVLDVNTPEAGRQLFAQIFAIDGVDVGFLVVLCMLIFGQSHCLCYGTAAAKSPVT